MLLKDDLVYSEEERENPAISMVGLWKERNVWEVL